MDLGLDRKGTKRLRALASLVNKRFITQLKLHVPDNIFKIDHKGSFSPILREYWTSNGAI